MGENYYTNVFYSTTKEKEKKNRSCNVFMTPSLSCPYTHFIIHVEANVTLDLFEGGL